MKGDELEWYVTTSQGPMVLNTMGRRNVVVMDGKVILIDPMDNISEIDFKRMDKNIISVLNKTI